MKITKNIRISLYILIPILLWMISGLFKEDEFQKPSEAGDLFNVETLLSKATEYQPLIKLKASTKSEKRINVKAKTSGDVVKIGAIQGAYVKKDTVLCRFSEFFVIHFLKNLDYFLNGILVATLSKVLRQIVL